MQQFKIVLKNDKLKYYNRLGYFTLTIFILVYIFLAFFTGNELNTTNKIIPLGFVSITILLRLFSPNSVKAGWMGAALFLLSLGFSGLKYYWLTGSCCMLAILLQFAIKEKVAQFYVSYIKYPSFPSRKINWSDLSNCLLKDTLLTIDFKNNKVIQQLIDEKDGPISEKEFNDFCRIQLSNKSKESN